MNDVDKAYATQVANIQIKTGKSLEELGEILVGSGLNRHGELRDFFKRELGLGHGDANTIVHYLRKSIPAFVDGSMRSSHAQLLDEIYIGPKAGLRPIHERLMEQIEAFGEFEVSPKKGYLSLRRKKQFAMIGPATNTRVEVGLNIKGLAPSNRLTEMPPKSMCNFKVKLTDPSQIDAELIGWIRNAFDESE